MQTFRRSTVFALSLAGLIACGGRAATAPTPVAPLAVDRAPAPAAPAKAVVTFSTFNVTVSPNPSGGYSFNERFTLRETGGRSGATILDIASAVNGIVTDTTGPSCWQEPIHIDPNGTLDTFDAGYDALFYCAPFSTSKVPTGSVSVLVNFVDDDGQLGMTSATATVPGTPK